MRDNSWKIQIGEIVRRWTQNPGKRFWVVESTDVQNAVFLVSIRLQYLRIVRRYTTAVSSHLLFGMAVCAPGSSVCVQALRVEQSLSPQVEWKSRLLAVRIPG